MNSIKVNNWKVEVKEDKVSFYWYQKDTNEYQFVARYFVETIIEHGPRYLDLLSHEPKWKITKELMTPIVAWLKVFK